jgi:hypothetical protein
MSACNRKAGHLIKNLFSGGLALVCIALLLAGLYRNYDFLQAQHLSFSPLQFIISLFPLVLSYFFIPSMWCRILASLGVSLPYPRAFCIQYLSHIGKYIPGKVWAYISQSYLASKAHVSLAETLCSNVILMGLMHLNGLCIFALSFLVWNVFTFFIRCLLVLVSFFLMYFLLRMRWIERGINVGLGRLMGLQITLQCQSLPYAMLIIENALIWLIFSIGFHLMITSFYPVYMNQIFIIIGTYAISWLVGYYTFFFPGGLGVQEGIQVYLLTFFFPLPIAIVIALASRFWLLLGDTIVFLLAVILTMHENRLQRSAHGA